MPDLDAKKILVIRLSSLGDVVLTTAIFPSLKAHWPLARISVVTKAAFAPVFAGNPSIHEVLALDNADNSFSALVARVKRETWDVVIDLHANPRSWMLRLVAGGNWTVVVEKASIARHLLVYTKRAAPSLRRSVRERILDCLGEIDVPVTSDDTRLFPQDVEGTLARFGVPTDRPLIGVAPGARHATKRWPADRFATAAARMAAARGARIVLLGDKTDVAVADQVARGLPEGTINLTGRTSLSELIAVTSRLSFLLTNDSGLLHIGEALRIPLVAVFGPTVRAFGFAPYRESSRLVETEISCRPCTLHGNERCPLGHHRCMNDIAVDAVVGVA